MVRRIKEDLRVIQGGFPKRQVPPVILTDAPDVPELKLFTLLSQYQEAREDRLKNETPGTKNAPAWSYVICSSAFSHPLRRSPAR